MQKRGKQDWDFFFCTLAGKPASIRFDLSLLASIPLSSHPQLVYVIIPFQKPDSQGMINEKEAERMRVIEKDIVRLLTEDLKGIYAMRYTGKGRRAFYFYIPPHLEVADLLSTCVKANGIRTFSLGILADPHWRFFRVNIQDEWIADKYPQLPYRKVTPSEAYPQEIEHALCFPTEDNRSKFLEVTRKKNFAVSQMKYSVGNPDCPFIMTMSRMELNSPKQLRDLEESLRQLAQQFGGAYLNSQKIVIGK